ncbi:hypothetical protein OCL06_00440 [Alteromonas sp. ASW11-19]|uniref:Uncharacterized protein n=1 Tax=Alteromonas salexigens TaxID=2982530 RepID=A0ABT2VJS8_9ALTE|nr:hypothetical protein [Alteromonas salexigens]MCU7553058.1 hypothetical protein [Alteromonas salexigens]
MCGLTQPAAEGYFSLNSHRFAMVVATPECPLALADVVAPIAWVAVIY